MKRLALPPHALGVALAVAFLSTSAPGLAKQPAVTRYVDDFGPSFSPDGRTIAFSRMFSAARFGVDPHPVEKRAVILVMRADGSRKRVLRHARATFEYSPSFSPDGRWILFVRNERIFRMRSDGSGARVVRRDSVEQACPRFSPDGSLISFWRGKAGKSSGYFVMNADGTGVRRIVTIGGNEAPWGCPSWFPDENRLVFAKRFNLYVASVDGMSIERITYGSDKTLYRPAVSPDGRWIACDGRMQSGDGVFVMRSDGTGARRITPARYQNDAGATWSPGGDRIAFSREGTKGERIYVVNRDGSGLRRLSNFAR